MNRANFNSITKVWSGVKHQPIYNPNVSLGYLILEEMKKNPNRITQVSADTNVEITCREMRVRTIKVAAYLRNNGLEQGNIVGVIASNSENLAPVVFACFSLGLPVNTLAPVMTESDIVHMYSKTKPKIIFCDSNILQTVQKAIGKMTINPTIVTLMAKVEKHDFVDEIALTDECDVDSFV